MQHLIFTTAILLAVCSLPAQNSNTCACTNCPLEITDNATFQGFLDVTVDGPNDLAECPLTELCLTITHTWVGDLSVTLTSPGGINYLVMADADNDLGGCGTNSDNIDICLVPGTDNPITNNTEYNCNGTDPCLVGEWTLPCGGVTDPISGSLQAPNCDLDDFNQVGQPANGTWTLTVNDVCALDVGFLETWSLSFGCEVEACFSCATNGGFLDSPDITGCAGDADLNLNLIPAYTGSVSPPDPAVTDYIWIVTQGGNILEVLPDTDLTNLDPGTYELCGLSIEADDFAFFEMYEGEAFTQLEGDLADPNLEICADLSDNCLEVQIGQSQMPTNTVVEICENECFTLPDGSECCAPGPCEYAFEMPDGCDSLVIYELELLPTQEVFAVDTLCTDDCVTIDGIQYCPPGNYEIVFTNQFNCDSTLFLELIEVAAEADVEEPEILTCFNLSTVLDGSDSEGDTFEWTDADGNILGNDPQLTVDSAGTYFLTVGSTLGTVACSAIETVTVVADYQLPALPEINGQAEACVGDTLQFSVSNPDPNTDSYAWYFAGQPDILNIDTNLNSITLLWEAEFTGEICVQGFNPCGPGEQGCLDLQILEPPADPVLDAPATACGEEPPFIVSAPAATEGTEYVWTVPDDAVIVSGAGSPTIEVQWGDSEVGNICLQLTNFCGESEEICVEVQEACDFWDIPNAFSPNGDGTNDRFTVYKGSGVTITNFVIYNRWGKEIYNDVAEAGWDGTVDGEPAPADTYVYMIQLSLSTGETVAAEGEVLLLR